MTNVNCNIKDIGLNARLLAFCEREEVATVGDFLHRFEELQVLSPKAADKIMEAINNAEDGERSIVYIDVDKIKPHPDNPRKDVGDVSELAESVKQNGIMQNLTVIPSEVQGEYMTLIGHRRLAAAKAAGLDKVPCAVVGNLSRSEQVSIMLAENVQRKDLTPLEQADGIQMMLDLGDTVSTVVKKTSMSETTVRSRLNMLQLDRKAVEESVGRGGSITDYNEIYKIKDKSKQKKLLKSIGTSNFKWELQCAIDEQKRAEKKQRLIDFVEGFASKLDKGSNYTNYKWVKNYYSSDEKYEMPEGYDDTLNYYYQDNYGGVVVYTDHTEVEQGEIEQRREEAKQREAKEAERKERYRKLESISEDMLKSRVEFIREFKGLPQEKAVDKLCALHRINSIITDCIIDDVGDCIDWEDIISQLYPDSDREPMELIEEYIGAADPDKLLIINMLASIGFFDELSAKDWSCHYSKSTMLCGVYRVLEELGYKVSDTEREFIDGTHEAYIKEGEQE